MNIEHTERQRLWLGISLVAGGVFYRPLEFWARNAWDLSQPLHVFATASFGLVAGVLLMLGLIRFGMRILPAGLLVAGVLFTLFNFHSVPWLPPVAWIAVVMAAGVFFHLKVTDRDIARLTTVVLALTLVAPALNVGVQHIARGTPYPLNDVRSWTDAEPTGDVEDVLVVVVDSYPMMSVAEPWFGHDATSLEQSLKSAGFHVAPVSWSHNTFTGLAVPSILQLEQVADDSPKGDWGHRRGNYDIIGGESFVAGTLRDAGFQYIHVESGWDGGACRQVDVCLKSSWLDEANWNLLAPSLLADTLEDRFGSMMTVNTMRVVEHLTTLEVFGDGQHDFVYSHLLLPHAPYVVDSGCNVIPSAERPLSDDANESIRQQLSCVDSLLEEIVEKVGDTTAVLIAGDHGPGEGGQVGSASDEWSDADVAERQGALLAYKLPKGCDEPQHPTNVYAMRAIMKCTVVADLPTEPVGFLVGADEPEWVDPERLASIADRLSEGRLSGVD